MDKIVLITGASGGIGHSLALRLMQDGYKVYCSARRLDKMSDLEKAGARVIAADLSREDNTRALAQNIIDECGGVDILVNNAGYGLYGPVERVPLAEGREEMEVNFFSPVLLSQLFLPNMRARGGGRIINISSVAGKIYSPMSDWYVASKFALEGITDCMRIELRQFNIKVVLIEPSPIKTEWAGGALASLKENTDNTPYADFAERSYKMLSSAAGGGLASEPEAVVKKIMLAITARNPKPRYLSGRIAGISVAARFLMSSRMFDYVMRKQLKL